MTLIVSINLKTLYFQSQFFLWWSNKLSIVAMQIFLSEKCHHLTWDSWTIYITSSVLLGFFSLAYYLYYITFSILGFTPIPLLLILFNHEENSAALLSLCPLLVLFRFLLIIWNIVYDSRKTFRESGTSVFGL